MIRLIAKILVIGLLTFFLGNYFPWWICVVVSFIVSLFIQTTAFRSFASGLIANGLLWFYLSNSIKNNTSSIALVESVSELLGFSNSVLLVLITALIGGVCSGLAALSAAFFLEMFKKKEKNFIY